MISGGAIDQDGSSPRQETTAWILNLTLPIRNMYATDSASILAKAKKMIEATSMLLPRNPFEGFWGFKKDSDLWELA